MAQSHDGLFSGLNAHYLESLIQRYTEDPGQLDESWQLFFQGEGRELLEGAGRNGPAFRPRSIFEGAVVGGGDTQATIEAMVAQMRVAQLISSYRRHGHLKASIDPLGLWKRATHEHLDPKYWSLGPENYKRRFSTASVYGHTSMTLEELIGFLDETYARTIGAEFMHLTNEREVEWLTERCERNRNHCDMDEATQSFILERLCAAEAFEDFLHKKFLGAKRFSLEGVESLIPLLAFVIESSAQQGVREVVLGMPHRGRLNVLANIYKKDPVQIFAEFADTSPEDYIGRGDVKYHMGYSTDVTTRFGHVVHLSLAFNPSHLEAINPIVTGRVRAKQDRNGANGSVLPVLIHGDAAFPGQGLVAETLNLMSLPGYGVGGTIHIIVNNQIGFTTTPGEGRSSTYCTDIAKMIEVPIFHVNGEDPEAVAQTVKIATEYRQTFHKDFIIDMYGFRRYGHNETDEPHFTQPKMYQVIDRHPPVHDVYAQRLGRKAFAKKVLRSERKRLDEALTRMRNGKEPEGNGDLPMQGLWKGYEGGPDRDAATPETQITEARFAEGMAGLTRLPEEFSPHKKIERVINQRREMAAGEKPLDWGGGESLAFATLLLEGHPVRISGQDCQRGTFSHRHAMLHDQVTGGTYCPLAHLSESQGSIAVVNSPLSEAAVLGYELGYAMDTPEALVIWEAQFGDFANSAQVIIDQFLSSCEDKWERLSGLTLLLPHGYEGQGPEHSSARLERFLQLCAEDNIQVCNLTTPAQIFHALRRQVVRKWRKPLVVMTPKSLLRHPRAVSEKPEFTDAGFQRVIPEGLLEDTGGVTRAVFSSGKVYYDLLEKREALEDTSTALIRLEQLYPFPDAQLLEAVKGFEGLKEVVWCQEEPENMGAFYFLFPRLTRLFAGIAPVRWVTREASASPATGSKRAHVIEQTGLVDRVFQTPEA